VGFYYINGWMHSLVADYSQTPGFSAIIEPMVLNGGIVNDRAHRLLISLVGLYIDSGVPVGSESLSKSLADQGETVPPSTVRLELNRLEQEGFLTKQHRSGGRIPTETAYRAYVDSIAPGITDAELMRRRFDAVRALSGELRRLLEYAGEVLAEESGCLGFATSPSLADARITRFKIDPIEAETLLLRLELASGRSYHHLVKLPVHVRSFRLDALTSLLTDRLSGRTLGDVTESELFAIVNHATEWGKGYDLFIHPLHDLITDARLGEAPITVLHGTAGLLKASGDDPETLARAVEFLDDRRNIERTLGKVPKREGVSVIIGGSGGDEIDPLLEGLSLVVASYHLHSRSRGRLGVLGPIRMPYGRQMALVNSMSDLLSKVLISRELSPRFS